MGHKSLSAPVVDPKTVNAGLSAIRDSCEAVSVMITEMSESPGPSCWDELLAAKMELLYAQLAIALGKKV